MAIQKDNSVTREDIITKFNERIRDWVGTNITHLGSTRITKSTRVSTGTYQWGNGVPSTWYLDYAVGSSGYNAYSKIVTLDTTVGTIMANSVANGGVYNATIDDTKNPTETIVASDFAAEIGSSGTEAGNVARVMKNFLRMYTTIHKVRLENTGNIEPAHLDVVVKSPNAIPSAADLIDSDIETLRVTSNFKSGEPLNPAKFLTFIDNCRLIWKTRCVDSSPLETFKFNYCHNSCHTNRTCYNSRGRR